MKKPYVAHIKRLRSITDEILDRKKINGLVISSSFMNYYVFDDRSIPLKVNPHFAYWVPLDNVPNSFVIAEKGKVPKLLFFHPVDYWHKVTTLPKDPWIKEFEIIVVKSLEEALEILKKFKNMTYVGELDKCLDSISFKSRNDQEVINYFHYHRGIKDEYEINCLKIANELGAQAHKRALKSFKAKKSEYQIHLDYLNEIEVTEKELPYNNIIALNENTAILHYSEYHKSPPKQFYSFLVDAGASFRGYKSDITRTYSFKNDEFQNLINLMDKIQLELVSDMKIGKSFGDIHKSCHKKVAMVLSEAGIVKGEPDEKIARFFFPHGLGHPLGLQVHDVGSKFVDAKGKEKAPPPEYPHLRCTKVLEEGNVVTVEPGLYFIEILLEELKKDPLGKKINWKKVSEFKKFGGIRIEDDILVTKSGPRNLTRDAFGA
jgi:Xaa-Pro dipeptidase